MKAAIYNPYLDTLGGGERYTMAVATTLIKAGWKVDVEWSDQSIKKKLEGRFDINLSGVNFINNINKGNLYDLCFWVSDGSIPLLSARKNILHFQFPFRFRQSNNLINRMKLYRVNKIICNSEFTKGFIDRSFGVKSEVVYPPVLVKNVSSKAKENIILYVGRFSNLTQSKRQDVLIECFKVFFDRGNRDWKLILAGGTEVGSDKWIEELKEMSEGYPIEFVESPKFPKLKELYAKAKIFWSASGFGVDEEKEPTKVEHFGITLVEAMASGCVCFASKAGGHKEIIKSFSNGILWDTEEELIDETIKIISDKKKLKEISTKAKQDSKIFNYETFETKLLSLL